MTRRVGIPGRADGRVLTSGGASMADPFIIGKGTAADLSAAIQISGMSGSPDRYVGNTGDDEFDSLSGWTTLGALDTNNASDYASMLHIKKNSSGTQVDAIYKACPTIPFTMTVKIMAYLHTTNYQTPGIMIGEATLDGKMETWGPQYNTSVLTYLQRNQWTNRTSRGSTSSYSVNALAPFYLQIIVHSSTNVDFNYSTNGFIFVTLSAAYNPGFTVGSVGFCLTGFAAIAVEAIYDFVHFT